MPPPFLALALMAASGVGYEVALTRYFALAHYSEYGYWVISLAMAGFALSGVVLSLWRESFVASQRAWLRNLPLAALCTAAIGFYGCCFNPFNALEFQHPVLWVSQLWNISLFYLALFPFFFCCGLYVGLCFVCFEVELGKLYAFDLAGAGLGALAMLGAMFAVAPFQLPVLLLPLPALAGFISGRRLSSLALLAVLELVLAVYNPARLSEYKPMSYALQTEGARVLKSWASPCGAYAVLDDFTERLDLDLSNNASLMGISGTPAALGLYVDGNRLTTLPKEGYGDSAWFKAALESFPYELKPSTVLMIGTHGGFKAAAVKAPGMSLEALESDPELFKQIPFPGLLRRQPLEYLAHTASHFDLIDISADYATQDRFALSKEMLSACVSALNQGGLLSVGVSIQELGAYAARLVETLQQLFPADHVLIYRSAWSVRALVFKNAPPLETLKHLAAFCDQRSFDLSYAPLLAPAHEVWNELPSLGWDGEAEDALREEASRAFKGQAMACADDFDLRPATLDRPFFFSTIKLSKLGKAFEHLSELPKDEIGLLVNLAVLAQALLLGLLVMALPLGFSRMRIEGLGRVVVYFASLGLGYLFFELALIEKITPYLQDRAWAFSLVLSVMLIFSGLGSYFARSMGLAFFIILIWTGLAWALLDKALFLIWAWPQPMQALACMLMIAPLAFALGMPFSLGLSALAKRRSAALPWAWGLNGAFSVIAAPLAFLAARSGGYSVVAGAAFLVYFLAWISFPKSGN